MTPPPLHTAEKLLAELDALGVELQGDGDRLRYRPRDKVTADLADRMKSHKAELLALLAKRAAWDRWIVEQLDQLVPYQTADGRRGWVHPRYRDELERLGLF